MLKQHRSGADHKNIVEQGFTLVELLIVIVILGILAGIVVFAVGNLTSSASSNACGTEADTVQTAIQSYRAQHAGTNPTPTAADATDGTKADGWASALNMSLSGVNGAVTFDTAGNTINLTGSLSGPGGLGVVGGGILELGGANTFAGDMTVTAGTLQLDVTGSSAGNLRQANGTTLNLNFGGNYVVAGYYTNGVALPPGTNST